MGVGCEARLVCADGSVVLHGCGKCKLGDLVSIV